MTTAKTLKQPWYLVMIEMKRFNWPFGHVMSSINYGMLIHAMGNYMCQ